MLTIEQISNKYNISVRAIESNLSKIKPKYIDTGLLVFDGQRWSADLIIVPELTKRQYAKHIVGYDNSQLVDDIDLKTIIPEQELKVFGTIAPKQVKSITKMNHLVREVFDYYSSSQSGTTFFIYGIEDNTDYFDERQNRGFHFHYVTNATNKGIVDQINLTQMLEDQLGAEKINKTHTVNVSPYEMGIGNGGLKYSLKSSRFTGALIK